MATNPIRTIYVDRSTEVVRVSREEGTNNNNLTRPVRFQPLLMQFNIVKNAKRKQER